MLVSLPKLFRVIRKPSYFRYLSTIPSNFGATGGQPISNIDTVLDSIDKSLSVTKPPAVEFLLVEGTHGNPFGHAAVSYTLPTTKERIVMNIVGIKGKDIRMLNLLSMKEYIFGVTPEGKLQGEQGGIYNRNICGVRVENLPDSDVLSMHHLFQSIMHQENSGRAAFTKGGNLHPLIQTYLPEIYTVRGNCARWTGRGLSSAGLIRVPSMFPKVLWITVFETALMRYPDNVNVVYYEHVAHAVQMTKKKPLNFSIVSPLQWINTLRYWSLKDYADVIVQVPNGTTTAVIKKMNRDHQRVGLIRRYHQGLLTFGIVTSSYIYLPSHYWMLIAGLFAVVY